VSARTTNLNLIPVLQALLEEVSVARAAKRVYLSQPSVSGALARLREDFDDPLLVRVGRSMRLTPKGERLRVQVNHLCAEIERLYEPDRFDPSTTNQSFVVAAPDYLAFLLSKAMLGRLHDEAPGVHVRFVEVPMFLPEKLHDRTIDLAVCAHFDLWPGLSYESLFLDRMVAVVANDHPLALKRSVCSGDLASFPGVDFYTGDADSSTAIKPLTGVPSLDWSSQITLSQFTDAVLLALDSPNVARAPLTLVDSLSKIAPLTVLEFSAEFDHLDTGMFWAPVPYPSPEQDWLKAVVRDCFAAAATSP
jgi:DNA-binding transcriptional LysR family regulator